jgi:type III pantothenate kinase
VAPSLLVLDVGNTTLKAVLFDAGGGIVSAARIPFGPGFAAPPLPGEGAGIVAVSVSEGNLAVLEAALGTRLACLGRDRDLPIPNRTRHPGETGADRLCAALAAHARARGAAVAVGVGTAVTADAVDRSGAFLGGAIAPGLGTAAAGLAAAAPRLPAARLGPGPAPFPGDSTAAALRAGHLRGFAGLVDRLAEEAARAAAGDGDPASVPVYLHGGDAEALAPLLRTKVVLVPHLVAEGARLAWLKGAAG